MLDLHTETLSAHDEFRRDVIAGLTATPKSIAPKYFYDERGSQLFDRICELPEYYPTRTEAAILREHAGAMAADLGAECLLIEPGAGSGLKTRLLLQALQAPSGYVPVDISADYLQHSAAAIGRAFPDLEVLPVAADFTQAFTVPRPRSPVRRRVLFFPGSTLGNFEPAAARQLLAQFRRIAGADGYLLLGVDLQKSADVLQAAYDDAAGVTAQFNLNLLARINRELDGNFDLAAFEHQARYVAAQHRIEMHLLSLRDQVVRVAGRSFRFRKHETLHTENSYKFTPESVAALACAGGWRLLRRWSDARGWFAVLLFTGT